MAGWAAYVKHRDMFKSNLVICLKRHVCVCLVGQCRKCGESNHVTKKCRHEVAVTCFTCGQKGHKNNHHHHPSR